MRGGYDHVNYIGLTGNTGQPDGESELISASVGYAVKPGMLAGIELGGGLLHYTGTNTFFNEAKQWNAGVFMRRVDVVEQTKFNAGRVFGKNRKVDAVAEPGRAERVRFSGPGLYRCHKRDVLISHANPTRNPRFFARLAEFVAQKNRQ